MHAVFPYYISRRGTPPSGAGITQVEAPGSALAPETAICVPSGETSGPLT